MLKKLKILYLFLFKFPPEGFAFKPPFLNLTLKRHPIENSFQLLEIVNDLCDEILRLKKEIDIYEERKADTRQQFKMLCAVREELKVLKEKETTTPH